MIPFKELDESLQVELLTNSAALLRSVTNSWGPEQGMELWETISTALGTDLKAELFFGFITGKYHGDVMLTSVNTDQAVPIIKSIRAATGLGLREAKDIYDSVKYGTRTKIKVGPDYRARFVSELRSFGCTVE